MTFRQDFDKAELAISKIDGEREQVDHDILTLEQQLAATAGAESIPTPDALASARANVTAVSIWSVAVWTIRRMSRPRPSSRLATRRAGR